MFGGRIGADLALVVIVALRVTGTHQTRRK
jgi:hypothetical protein